MSLKWLLVFGSIGLMIAIGETIKETAMVSIALGFSVIALAGYLRYEWVGTKDAE